MANVWEGVRTVTITPNDLVVEVTKVGSIFFQLLSLPHISPDITLY